MKWWKWWSRISTRRIVIKARCPFNIMCATPFLSSIVNNQSGKVYHAYKPDGRSSHSDVMNHRLKYPEILQFILKKWNEASFQFIIVSICLEYLLKKKDFEKEHGSQFDNHRSAGRPQYLIVEKKCYCRLVFNASHQCII